MMPFGLTRRQQLFSASGTRSWNSSSSIVFRWHAHPQQDGRGIPIQKCGYSCSSGVQFFTQQKKRGAISIIPLTSHSLTSLDEISFWKSIGFRCGVSDRFSTVPSLLSTEPSLPTIPLEANPRESLFAIILT